MLWLDVVMLQGLVVWCSEVLAALCPALCRSDLQTALVHKDICAKPKLRESFGSAHRDAGASAVRVALDRSRPLAWLVQEARKLNTEHGAHGEGGQPQRPVVARNELAGLPVVSRDELGECLDPATADGLADRTRSQTAVLVGHRLAGMEHGDEVPLLDAGRLIGRGGHADRGRHALKWQRQRRFDTVIGVLG